jgi:hypothetical protein
VQGGFGRSTLDHDLTLDSAPERLALPDRRSGALDEHEKVDHGPSAYPLVDTRLQAVRTLLARLARPASRGDTGYAVPDPRWSSGTTVSTTSVVSAGGTPSVAGRSTAGAVGLAGTPRPWASSMRLTCSGDSLG